MSENDSCDREDAGLRERTTKRPRPLRWYLWRVFKRRQSALARRLLRKVDRLERNIRRLERERAIADSSRLVAEHEAKTLALVVARNQKRLDAEAAEFAARQVAAEQGRIVH